MVLILDDLSSLKMKIDRRASNLFGAAPKGQAPLQVMRIAVGDDGERSFVGNEDVLDEPNLNELRNNANILDGNLQIFSIRQGRTWSTLDISRELFEAFTRTFGVFAPFWKCVFAFGVKNQENEFEFPGAIRRRIRNVDDKGKASYTHEFSYMMRRAENNGRHASEDDSWSIRQTAVYHKFTPSINATGSKEGEQSTFLMIAPSPNAEHQYKEYLEQSKLENYEASIWNIHRVLVADGIRGWGDYMASLEKRLLACSDRIVMADVGTTTETLSPLKDFIINFEDRQDLKVLEDSVVDLLVILPKFVQTIKDIKMHCMTCHSGVVLDDEEAAETQAILDEFDEYIKEMEMYSDQARALNTSAQATTQLLSDLLSYEEAVAMKDLTVKARDESTSMRWLAERSTKDAAAVKILTVITLIYLPFTIVANFFSTEFVQTSDKGSMILARNFWLLFAIAIPLTAFTIMLWWAWVHFTRMPNLTPTPVEFQRQSSFKAMIVGNKNKVEDPEKGIVSPKGSPKPSFPGTGGGGTWSSAATTLKPE